MVGSTDANMFTMPDIMTKLSLFERFYTFVNGVFDLTAIIYYVTVIVFFLFLSVQSLERFWFFVRWRMINPNKTAIKSNAAAEPDAPVGGGKFRICIRLCMSWICSDYPHFDYACDCRGTESDLPMKISVSFAR